MDDHKKKELEFFFIDYSRYFFKANIRNNSETFLKYFLPSGMSLWNSRHWVGCLIVFFTSKRAPVDNFYLCFINKISFDVNMFFL